MEKRHDAQRKTAALRPEGRRLEAPCREARWEIQAERIARELRQYDYKDIRRELHAWARGKKRQRNGGYTPLDNQIQWLLAHAEWSEQISPKDNHTPAKYRHKESGNVSDIKGGAARR